MFKKRKPVIELVSNKSTKSTRVNIVSLVNNNSIRLENYNGREHWVIPSYTLPSNVIMNNGLYPASEIDAHYQGLEGTLAPLGHPVIDGNYVSAFSPEGINGWHVGAWNKNVKKSGDRVYLEKWVDIEVAKNFDKGRRLLDRLNAIKNGEDVMPIHTSVSAFLERIPATIEQKKDGYEWIARIDKMDHDAILLDDTGAATPEQGVGLMVNADSAVPVTRQSTLNEIFEGETYREKEKNLEEAAYNKLCTSDDCFLWVADFTDNQLVVVKNGDEATLYNYELNDGKVVIADNGIQVERKESWINKIPVVNWLTKVLKGDIKKPNVNQNEGSKMDEEERKKFLDEVVSTTAERFTEALKPLTEKIEEVEANQKSIKEDLTANARAAEKEQREAVAKVHGEVVANALTGDALADLYKNLGQSKNLGDGKLGTNNQEGAPALDEYFGEGA